MKNHLVSKFLMATVLLFPLANTGMGDEIPRIMHSTHTYKKVGDLEIKADVYRLDNNAILPVVVWIHGGALIMGSRESFKPSGIHERLLNLGMAVVSIDYRLAPETKLPAIIEDLEDAFKWVHF